MALHAKPRDDYEVDSDDWKDNVNALWAYCHSLGYTVQAVSGMLGNAQSESGMNPWRYQNDSLSGAGYGLFQYTPKAGYLEQTFTNDDGETVQGYGYGYQYFAPNRSITAISSGAQPTDAYCQIDAIPRSGKYASNAARISRVSPYVADYANYDTLDKFKTCTDVEKATYLWVGFFEYPGWWRDRENVDDNFSPRYDVAVKVYDLIKDDTDPEIPDTPTPEPPTPTPTDTHKMKWIFYMGKRWVI